MRLPEEDRLKFGHEVEEEKDPTVPAHVKDITEENIETWGDSIPNSALNDYSNINVEEQDQLSQLLIRYYQRVLDDGGTVEADLTIKSLLGQGNYGNIIRNVVVEDGKVEHIELDFIALKDLPPIHTSKLINDLKLITLEEVPQADWTETDIESKGYIKNVPTEFPPSSHTHPEYENTPETDPTVPQYVKNILEQSITNWNTAFSWGDFRQFGLESAVDISGQNMNNITDTGFYYGTTYNGADGGGASVVSEPWFYQVISSATHCFQIAYERRVSLGDGRAGRRYRQQVNGTWGPWINMIIDETDVNEAISGHTHSWTGITDKPTSFPPSTHNHDDRYYTEEEVDTLLVGKSNTGHEHPEYENVAETDPTVPAHVKSILSSDITEWNTAYDKRVTGINISGTDTKTINISFADGTSVSGSFPDLQGTGGVETETDPKGLAGLAVTGTTTKTITATLNDGSIITSQFSDKDTVYTHPAKAWVDKTNLSGAVVISNITIDSLGHATGWTTRTLTAADIGAEPAFSKNGAFNKNYGTTVGTTAQGNDSRILNGQTAYEKRITGISFSGTSTKTATITLADGSTVTGTFTDIVGETGTSDGNDYVSGGSFSTSTGIVTLNRTDGGTVTFDLDGRYEISFSKNSAFNKNFGTTSGTVAQGNDSRILNGQTAFSWGNHASAGYLTALPSHTHTLSEITDAGNLASKNTNGSTSNYLRGDGTWVTPPNTVYTGGTGITVSGNTITNSAPHVATNLSSSRNTTTYTITSSTGTNTSLAGATTSLAGLITTGTQSFAGAKTFTSNVNAPDFVGTSDERLKENIKEYAPKEVDSDYKNFNFKGDKQLRVGVIAQELEVNHPEFVRTNEDGIKSVSYTDLHSAEIAYLKQENKLLKERLERLERLLLK